MTRRTACLLAALFGLWSGLVAAQVRVHDVPIPGPAETLPKEPLRVVSWNIAWFPGGHPTRATPESTQRQEKAVRATLQELKPHILLGMEIRDSASWRSLTPDWNFHFVTSIPRPPDENPDLPNQGLAIASRARPRAAWVVDFSGLPQTPDRPVRGLLAAEFIMANGEHLVVYAVHLKSNRGAPESNRLRRQRAIRAMLDDWKRLGLDPARDRILVAGDFNTSTHDPQFQDEKTLRLLEEAGLVRASAGRVRTDSYTVAAGTFPPNDFDHIFISRPLAAHQPGPPPWGGIHPFIPDASDHAAIWLDLP